MARDHVLEQLQTHSTAFFDLWVRGPGHEYVEEKSNNRHGFRSVENGKTNYWVTAVGFKKLRGKFNHEAVCDELKHAGILQPDGAGKNSKSQSIPGQGKARYYHLVIPTVDTLEGKSDV